eukprot:2719881-Amphidinium_carterae.1
MIRQTLMKELLLIACGVDASLSSSKLRATNANKTANAIRKMWALLEMVLLLNMLPSAFPPT